MTNMEIISDTSVIISVILNEPEKDRIVELTVGYDIIAPMSVKWEVGNAFSAMIKRKRLDVDSAIKALTIFNKIPIKYVDVSLENALRIACEQNIYAYDAYFIECAIRHKKALITLDRQLLSIARSYKINVMEVCQ